MKTFLILFKTGSIPFSSNKKIAYIEDWKIFLDQLKNSTKLQDHSFLKKDSIFISGKNIEQKSYIPHKEIFSGYLLIKANNTKEIINICKNCPVFKRGGDIQIKEVDKDYLDE